MVGRRSRTFEKGSREINTRDTISDRGATPAEGIASRQGNIGERWY